jgi:anoctamin-1
VVAVVMILVRWCIPDMSVTLKDTIRREVYVTNEIIIQQETMRARLGQGSQHTLPRSTGHEKTAALAKWQEIWNENLSGSQLDLKIFENNAGVSGIGRRKSRRDDENESFLLNERIISKDGDDDAVSV